MELREDVSFPEEMGDFRWLTVGPPGQDDVSIVLMAVPGAPVMDEDTRKQVLDLTAKGFAGTVFLTTDDAQASLRGADRARRRLQRAAQPDALRHRLRLPRPLGQQRAADPAHRDHLEGWGDGSLVEHDRLRLRRGRSPPRGASGVWGWCGPGGCVAFGGDVGGALLGAGAAAPRHHRGALTAAVLRVALLRRHVCGRRAQLRRTSPLPGVVTYLCPAGDVQMIVPSRNCSSRQPQNVLLYGENDRQLQVRRPRRPTSTHGDGVIDVGDGAGNRSRGTGTSHHGTGRSPPTPARARTRLRRRGPGMNHRPQPGVAGELDDHLRRDQTLVADHHRRASRRRSRVACSAIT